MPLTLAPTARETSAKDSPSSQCRTITSRWSDGSLVSASLISWLFRGRGAHVDWSQPHRAEAATDLDDARGDARADFHGEVALLAGEVFRLDEALLFAVETDENGVAADLHHHDVEFLADVERAAARRRFSGICFEEGGERFALGILRHSVLLALVGTAWHLRRERRHPRWPAPRFPLYSAAQ